MTKDMFIYWMRGYAEEMLRQGQADRNLDLCAYSSGILKRIDDVLEKENNTTNQFLQHIHYGEDNRGYAHGYSAGYDII